MRTAAVLMIVLATAAAAAQEKPAVPPPAQAPGAAAAPAPATPPFVYNPEGRRDSFVSHLTRAAEDRARQVKQPPRVAFRGRGANVLLPPTNSLPLARRKLAGLPTGGRTPFSAGLRCSIRQWIEAGANR